MEELEPSGECQHGHGSDCDPSNHVGSKHHPPAGEAIGYHASDEEQGDVRHRQRQPDK